MLKYPQIFYKHKLFNGIAPNDLDSLTNCLGTKIKEYKKQAVIFKEGETTDKLGIVLTGSVHIYAYDFYGNRQIITNISKGGMFAESFSVAKTPLPFEICAAENCSVCFIKYSKICAVCQKTCSFHTLLISNLMQAIAVKNINLTQKIRHITEKKVSGKVLSYLNTVSKNSGSNYFEIPFNRQELADYLSVDRSNLSNELCKLKQSGLIEFEKNFFKLKGKFK